MKTKILHITSNLFLTTMIVMISISSFGQSRNSNNQGKTTYSRGTASVNRNVNNTRQERTIVESRKPVTVQSSRNLQQNRKNDPKPANNNNAYNQNNKGHSEYKSNDHSWNHSHNSYAGSWNGNGHRVYYSHPKTYNGWNYPAPWKYSTHAVVFRHDHGDYYFYNNRFYRYDPFRGYYLVDFPGGVIFSYLPIGFREVMWNGLIYYRYGNIYLEYTPLGYRVVPPESGIYFSMNINF